MHIRKSLKLWRNEGKATGVLWRRKWNILLDKEMSCTDHLRKNLLLMGKEVGYMVNFSFKEMDSSQGLRIQFAADLIKICGHGDYSE